MIYFLFCSAPVLLPLKNYKILSDPEDLKVDLKKVGGVYGFINLKDGKQYTIYRFQLESL